MVSYRPISGIWSDKTLILFHADRVFGYALNTVNKIRTDGQKPPLADRLRLYGLYKQSMEGDVRYVASRPSGNSDAVRKEQDKWEAWNENTGLSRTEAKKRYIETLISTMHAYASTTPEARELVSELEFVWEQVRNNSQPSSNSQESPLQLNESGQGAYPGLTPADDGAFEPRERGGTAGGGRRRMKVLDPATQGVDEELDDERDEFVDAPVSQYDDEQDSDSPNGRRKSDLLEAAAPEDRPPDSQPRKRVANTDVKWRRRVETALIKMTAEVAALREQLESRTYSNQRRKHTVFGWLLRFGWFLIRAVAVDFVVLWIVILYLRRKQDRRLEGAVRVLLGDAVATMQSQMQKVGKNVPKLPSRKP